MSAPVVFPKKKASKPKVAASHPPVINMIKAAITAGKDRKGCSLPTIKKYILANYKFDTDKYAAHIRRGIVQGVTKGVLIRVGNKGKGASGSFKVADTKAAAPKPVKKVVKPKVKAAAKPKKAPAAKKSTPKKVSKPKTKVAKKPKSPTKKVAKKAPAVKKPKTIKKATAKKVAKK